MKFLIQVDSEGQIIYQHSFYLLENIRYQRWRGEEMEVRFISLQELTKDGGVDLKDYIPSGSIEFVVRFIHEILGIPGEPRPLNIPAPLLGYRDEVYDVTLPDDLPLSGIWYVKSATKIKSPENGVYRAEDMGSLSPGEYQISEYQSGIQSEYRCFVSARGELLDSRCYSGDFKVTPNYGLISEMIRDFGYGFPYILDVFIDSNGRTQILECHEFWSCGLYGFEYQEYCKMVSQGFYHEISKLSRR